MAARCNAGFVMLTLMSGSRTSACEEKHKIGFGELCGATGCLCTNVYRFSTLPFKTDVGGRVWCILAADSSVSDLLLVSIALWLGERRDEAAVVGSVYRDIGLAAL